MIGKDHDNYKIINDYKTKKRVLLLETLFFILSKILQGRDKVLNLNQPLFNKFIEIKK